MKAMAKTAAEEIAAAIRTSGVSMEAILAALTKNQDKSETKTKGGSGSEGKTRTASRPISTQEQAEKARPGVRRVKHATGLYLNKRDDSGSWFLRFWFGGKRREMGLGPLGQVKLADAKDEALKIRVQIKAGVNPITARRAAKADTATKAEAEALAADRWVFERATDEYLAAHAPSWKHARARAVWHNPIIRYAYPVIGKMQLDDIRVQHVDAVMTAAVEGGAPQVAPRIRLRIEQILNAAAAKGKRDAALPNPAAVKLVKAVRPTQRKGENEHFRRIPLADAPAAFRKLNELAANSTPRSALIFMISTAARPSEALNARWDEIDFDKKLWMNPVSKTRGKADPLPVLLSPITLDVLRRQQTVRTGDMVFPGRGGSPVHFSTFSAAPKDAGLDVGTPHSWRSIFRDWADDIGGFRRETAEAALAHSLGAVESAYRRETAVQARTPMMAAYADWLTGKSENNVVAFKTGVRPTIGSKLNQLDRWFRRLCGSAAAQPKPDILCSSVAVLCRLAPLPKRHVDRRIADKSRHQHGCRTHGQHWQQDVDAVRHLRH
jgi:integrase